MPIKKGAFLIIAGAILGVLLTVATYAAREPKVSAVPEVNQRVENLQEQSIKIVSNECPLLFGHHVSDITIVNSNSSTLQFLHAFVNFKDKTGKIISSSDSGFQPTEIPPGSRASAHVIPNTEGGTICELVGIQDESGHPIAVRQ